MRGPTDRILAVVLSALTLLACDPGGSSRPVLATARELAAATQGKVVVLIDYVAASAYAGAAPTRCAISYAVFNNTVDEVRDTSVDIGGYAFAVADLPAHDQYFQDQILFGPPINGSCVEVAKGLRQAAGRFDVSRCPTSRAPPDDCRDRFAAVVDLDDEAIARIQRGELAARLRQAEQLQLEFREARGQAWAQRGRYQIPVGGALVQADARVPIMMTVVLAQTFDPSKPDDAAPADPTTAKFCHLPFPVPADQPPGRLSVSTVVSDQYGLAEWYRLHMVCSGWPDRTVWVRAAAIESLLKSGKIAKPPPPGASPTATVAAAKP